MNAMRARVSAASKSFNAADGDGSGGLTYKEFAKMPQNLGLTPKQTKADFAKLDRDRSGTIDRHEFLRIALCDALSRNRSEVSALLKSIDMDGNRKIDSFEFIVFVKKLGFDARPADVNQVFAAIDTDGSGFITPKELEAAIAPDAVGKLRPKMAAMEEDEEAETGGGGGGGARSKGVSSAPTREPSKGKGSLHKLLPRAQAAPGAAGEKSWLDGFAQWWVQLLATVTCMERPHDVPRNKQVYLGSE